MLTLASQPLNPQLRDYFDAILEEIAEQLPEQARALLEEVPLYVEDYPSREMMRDLGISHRAGLCGLYTGIPLGQRRIEQSGVLSDVIHVFREGVLGMATDRRGHIDEQELRRQIRITILHELGHHYGMTEEELESLGY